MIVQKDSVSKKELASLFEAIAQLQSSEEAEAFLRDLCTPMELKAMEKRWKVCQHLALGKKSYREIHSETKVSLTTIGRVARFLKEEKYQGYLSVLKKLNLF